MNESFGTSVKAAGAALQAILSYTLQRAEYLEKPSPIKRAAAKQARRMLFKHLHALEMALELEDRDDAKVEVQPQEPTEK